MTSETVKPKICITTLEFPPDIGGVGQSVSRIANMLTALGYEVHVAVFRAVFRNERAMAEAGDYRRATCHTSTVTPCPTTYSFDTASSQDNSITVHRLYPAVRSVSAKSQDYLCDLHSQLQTLHRTYQFDLFHAFFINEMGFLTTLVAKENNLPVINSVRGADLNKHVFDPAQFSQVSWTLANSTWTTFVSKNLRQRAIALVPDIQQRSSAFWNAIVPFSFDDLPTPALASQLKGIVIGSVGSFRDKKGLEYLFDACQRLRGSTPLTLLLVGDFADKERDYWEKALQESGFADRTLITGKISRQEALAYLPLMDIFAIPSLRDGCPNALLEAMLAAKAVVGSDVDAIGEIIDDGKDGLLVNAADTDSLETSLQRLIAQPDLRQQLGLTARQKVLTQLAPAIEQQNWQAIYQRLLGISSEQALSEMDTVVSTSA